MRPDFLSFFRDDGSSSLVVGTYLFPHRLLAPPDFDNPMSVAAVMRRVTIDQLDVMVTVNGGLFVKPESSMSPLASDISTADLQQRYAFQQAVSNAFNVLICELCLFGIVSEPASRVHVCAGRLMDDHALVLGSVGGRETHSERQSDWMVRILRGDVFPVNGIAMWDQQDVLDQVFSLSRTNKLLHVSRSLPSLIAGAYSMLSRGNLGEALIDAWFVCEQVLDYWWCDYVAGMSNRDRTNRLRDSRTYTAAVRTEILYTSGRISSDLYDRLNKARQHRNQLAHRALINEEMALDTVSALKASLDCFLGESVSPFAISRTLNW